MYTLNGIQDRHWKYGKKGGDFSKLILHLHHYAPYHKNVWGSGGMAAHILDLVLDDKLNFCSLQILFLHC